MSIIGGAVITPVMGFVSDQAHLIRVALYVPAGCFAFLAMFGLIISASRSHRKSADRLGDLAPSMGN
jgi:fucose permease